MASIYLGSNTAGIKSIQDSACPISENQFKYWYGGKFHLAPNNSVSIQCYTG